MKKNQFAKLAAALFCTLFMYGMCAFSQDFTPIRYTRIYDPSTIERLTESTGNESFLHIHLVPGETEYEYFTFTIPSDGWFGFKTQYYSDTDSAGGKRPTSVSFYMDPDMTRITGKNMFGDGAKILLKAGTYYIRASFQGSYRYYGYFLACSDVIKTAQMVVTSDTDAYFKISEPSSSSDHSYYVSADEPADPANINYNAHYVNFILKTGANYGYRYNNEFYPLYLIGGKTSFMKASIDPNHIYYIHIYYTTYYRAAAGDQWKGWHFYVPVTDVIDLRGLASSDSTSAAQQGTAPSAGVVSSAEKAPSEGTVFSANGCQYRVLSCGTEKLAACTGFVKATKKTSVNIPATVRYQGVVWKVSAISKNAFKNQKAIKKLVIGKNVKTIKAGAFMGCKNLTAVVIKTSVLKKGSVGKNAFKGISAKAKVKVPSKRKKLYKSLLQKAGISRKAKIQ